MNADLQIEHRLRMFCATAVIVTILATLMCAGCNVSNSGSGVLAQVSRQQLTAEEEACVDMFRPPSTVYGKNLTRYDAILAGLRTAKNEAAADLIRAQARVFVQSFRDSARQGQYMEPTWRLRVPDSMTQMQQALTVGFAIQKRLHNGESIADDEIVQAWRNYIAAEQQFQALTKTRPYQPADTPQASLYLYITPRGSPITYEATQNQWYLTPTFGVGPIDVIPTYGPINSGGSGTALTRLVIRDPTTMTFRVWKLNTRMPKIKVPESWIQVEGSDLVISPVDPASKQPEVSLPSRNTPVFSTPGSTVHEMACFDNQSRYKINYSLRWGSQDWQDYSVEPNNTFRNWLPRTTPVIDPTELIIRFDDDLSDGINMVTFKLDPEISVTGTDDCVSASRHRFSESKDKLLLTVHE